MKKSLIAAIGAMMLSMTMVSVASAGTASMEYDAAASTKTVAVYEIYTKGFNTQVNNVSVKLYLDTSIVDIDNFNSADEAAAATVCQDLPGKILTAGGRNGNYTYNLSYYKAGGYFTVDESIPLATVSIPVKEGATGVGNMRLELSDGTTTTQQTITPILPQSATVTGTTISEDAASEAATYFSVETTGVDKATPYWYATVDGAAKKTAYKGANIAAGTNVKLGLVSVGSVSNAKIVWEVKENK